MKLLKASLFLLAMVSLICGCACNKKQEPSQLSATGTDSVGAQINDFAFRLYAQADKSGQNLFFSPYSISTAFGMVYGGAKGNTAKEIARVMSFTLPEAEQQIAIRNLQQSLNALGERQKAELKVANGLFGAKRHEDLLLPDYLKLLRENYASDLYSLDFDDAPGTAKFINKWVEDKTNDRIHDLVSPSHIEHSNDGLVLVNAIFFKGNWLKQFDPQDTYKDNFYLSGTDRSADNSKPAMMMHLQDAFPYAELPGCQILELPYTEEELAMMVVLPDDVDKLGKGLDLAEFKSWRKALKQNEVKVYLPSFKLELTLEGLSGMLQNMGIVDAFSDARADFTGIRKPGSGADLYIMDVLHKAFVEVKEEGTEAAAATAVVMETKAAPGPEPQIPVFRADHPFLYFILHKPTETILFMGKLAEPAM